MKFYLKLLTLCILAATGYTSTALEEPLEGTRRHSSLVVGGTNSLHILLMWDRIEKDPINSASFSSTLLSPLEWLKVMDSLFNLNLQDLRISNTGFDATMFPALRDLRNCHNLRDLDLSRNPLGHHGFNDFAPTLSFLTNLERLNLNETCLAPHSLVCLAQNLPASLKELSLTLYSPLQDEDAPPQEIENLIGKLVPIISQKCPHFENLKLRVSLPFDEKEKIENKFGCVVIITP